MKKLLRKVFSARQYKALSRLRNKTLPDLRYRLGQSPFLLIGSVIKVLPDNSRVTLKSGINVVKKLDYKRRDVFLSVESDFEYRVRLHSCEKEPDTVQWIEDFLEEGAVLYDIGANDGAYSLVASKFHDGKVKVYAFEPSFLNFTQLCKNVLLNDCQESVIPLQIALSDTTAIEDFNYRTLVPGAAVHAFGEAIGIGGEAFTPVAKQPVLGYRLDDLISQFQMPTPNHLKIDVDGIEYSILRGMEQTLSQGVVRSLMVEVNPARGESEETIAFLTSKGFVLRSNHGVNHLFSRDD